MERNFYLLRLEINGIKNIRIPIEFDFYKKTISNNFNPEKHKIKGIYGENGSGKTAVITAVKILKNLILDKSYLNDSYVQNTLREIINKNNSCGHIECEFMVLFGETKYIFKYNVSFEIREDERFYLCGEKLEIKNGNYTKNKYVCLYEVNGGNLIYADNKDFYEYFNDMTRNLLEQRTLATWAFAVIPGENVDITPLKVLVLFALDLYVYIDNGDNHDMYFLHEEIKGLNGKDLTALGTDFLAQINRALFRSREDAGMVRKTVFESYKKYVSKLTEFIRIFKPELINIEIDSKDFGDFYKCNLNMIYDGFSFDKEFESQGIKKLMNIFAYLDEATKGSIVFIDELDSSINDVYLDKIIEHFMYYGEGQLCFTAHNLSPMSILKNNKDSITFISNINTVHTWANNGNKSPENTYKNGFIEDSPFNVDAVDFLGIIGGEDE